MPQLEEGNLWIRDTAPLNISLARQAAISERGPRDHGLVPRGRGRRQPDRADRRRRPTPTATTTPSSSCPCGPKSTGRRSSSKRAGGAGCYGPKRPRTKDELIADMDAELERKLPGVDLEFLAEHPRQRDGSALRNQGRQLAEDRRSRLQQAPGPRQRRPRTSCRTCPGWRTWESSTSWGNRTWRSASTRKNASGGACRWPT